MTDTTYNGWSNYATWNVNLWLDNDEGFYHDLVSLTHRALVSNTPEEATEELAVSIRSYVEAIWAQPWNDSDETGSFGDLRADDGDTLEDVDWEEIAAAWVDTWKDEED
jgi:hypothetical protein